MPELIRGISWGKTDFPQACDMVSFEAGTKPRCRNAPVDPKKEGREVFAETASVLNDQLIDRDDLLKSGTSYADFRMVTFSPVKDVMNVPELPEIPWEEP